MCMEIKVRKIGNAVGLIIPKVLAEKAEFRAGEALEISISKDGVTLQKKNNDLRQRILKGILASDQENGDFSKSFNDLVSNRIS